MGCARLRDERDEGTKLEDLLGLVGHEARYSDTQNFRLAPKLP